ncbi:hypothetical protein PCASD_25137 [Puccinia coronata f. sp. avenae]|uniref:Uncharacterized protein n=1 Tax=Puccinia coronata f. sp. avenae TaxID=200324 RepID=A0A2N5TM68_9BASI|nr:hypothetical protein PCASD_25137 [Puccinia coronata f. sp. avenae]
MGSGCLDGCGASPAYVYLSGSDFGLPALTWSGFHQLCLAPPPHHRLLIEQEPAWPRTRICLTSLNQTTKHRCRPRIQGHRPRIRTPLSDRSTQDPS